MTIRRYDEDPYCLTFDAVVTSCRAQGDAFAVTLDRTAFFPEGGGQGADHGTLGDARVTDVHEVHGEVIHTADRMLEPGAQVHGSVDAVRRLDMMQQHSGEHIFSGLVHQLHGYDNVGFHMDKVVTVDFSGPMTMEEALEIEKEAKQLIYSNVETKITFPTEE